MQYQLWIAILMADSISHSSLLLKVVNAFVYLLFVQVNKKVVGMQDFYEDLFEELSKYGEIESLNICDNLADHMVLYFWNFAIF